MSKKKWLMMIGSFFCLIAVGVFLLLTHLKIENDWGQYKEKMVVLPNKIWRIHFSEKLDKKTINDKTIYITDQTGRRQDVTIKLSNDSKTLLIYPPKNGYSTTPSSYTLNIKNGIKSVYQRGLFSSKERPFVVRETLPVIGSKSTLDHYFAKIIKEQKNQEKRVETKFDAGSKKEASTAMSADSAQEISETNVQVQGVDESDLVKTNNTHIFQAIDNKVNIIKATPASKMKLETQLTFKEGFSPSQLYLHNNKLAVLGHSYTVSNIDESKKKVSGDSLIVPMNESTKVIVYDIKNPQDPKIEREIMTEGHLVTSRKINENIYLVSNAYPDFWILEDNKKLDLRPKYSDSADSKKIKAIDYAQIQYFPDSKETNYTMITAFNVDKPSDKAKITTYLGSGDELYMSKENMYLAVANYAEMPVIADKPYSPDTNIYKFSINGLKITFDASVEVNGTVLNQFSMDEHDGLFRIATTKGDTWDENEPSANNLYIFDENLKPIGELEDLARGERIYSARFMGDRIYIVTFKETDPLFVIDASRPNNPKILGELKIPGFSNYLHPYDETHVIGFGHDTKIVKDKGSKEPQILTDGVKISLFDISDISKPREQYTEVIGGRGTNSPLEYDHKALLYNKNKNLFAFPVHVYHNVKGSEYEQTFKFQGAYVYNLDLSKGFTLKSKITHVKGKSLYEDWATDIHRLVYIGDTLYALSPSKITAHSMGNYITIGSLELN